MERLSYATFAYMWHKYNAYN